MKYLNLITLLILLCSTLPLWGQQSKNCDNVVPQYSLPENSVWAMGDSLGMDFNPPGGPTAISTKITGTGASVADSSGQLLFYSDGMTVYDAGGSFMPNGSQLWGGSWGFMGQSIQIVQVPYQTDKYYVFTIRGDGFYCNLIDMSLNNGMGEVVWSFPLRGYALANTNTIGLALRIAAVPDCSGNVWVLIHDGDPVFRAFKVTAAGIDTVPVVSDFSSTLPLTEDYGNGSIGNIAVSPNGKRVVLNHSTNTGQYQLACYDFDPATGAFSNPRNLKTGGNTNDRGIGQSAFSPDNSKLYSMAYEDNHHFILQYDFNSGVADSLIEPDSIGFISSGTYDLYLGTARLGPDGKIYFGTHGMESLSHGLSGFQDIGRINYPNNPGAACGFQDSVASVDFSSLPVTGFFYGFFPTQTVIPESSLQISVHLQGDTLFAQPNNFDSYRWYFNGNALTADTAAYLPVTDTGLYAVKVVDSSCGCTDSVVYHLSELPGLGIAPVGRNPMRVYPNPTKNKIFVPSPMALNLSLYDLTGRLLLQEKDKKQMDLSALPDGLYLLKIEDTRGRFIKMEKVVKRK